MGNKFTKQLFLLCVLAFSLIILSAFVSAMHDTMDLNKLQPYPHCWEEDNDQTGCEANASKGCFWFPKNSTAGANNTWCANQTGCCRVVGCEGNRSNTWTDIDWKNETRCRSLLNDTGLACQWISPQTQSFGSPGTCMSQTSCFLKTGTSQNACENSSFFGGKCKWNTTGTYCYNSTGCCEDQWCESNWMQNLTKCMAASNLGQYCSWNGTNCTHGWSVSWGGDAGNGTTVNSSISNACGANNNNSAGCKGTNWCTYDNTTGGCLDPYVMGTVNSSTWGVHCWFADNNPGTCRNISGCIYCANGTNSSNADSSNASVSNQKSFCYNKSIGWCEGHQEDADTNYFRVQPAEFNKSLEDPKADGWLSNSSLNCSDFNASVSKACDCGPLPGCTWNGNECRPGPSKCDLPDAPVTFCDGVMSDGSKVNETTCIDLKTKWFMNCAWSNATGKCSFDWGDIGDTKNDSTDTNYAKITNENDCLAAKGEWIKEAYCDAVGNTNYETWCEMGSGTGYDNCDDICGACDWFFPNGSIVASIVQASTACNKSALGYCSFVQDSKADNAFGRCEQPLVIDFGSSGDCNAHCKDCELLTSNVSARCNASFAGCKLDVPTGACINNNTLGCDSSCGACYSEPTCASSKSNCTWDTNSFLCKSPFATEICFDGIDNDNDFQIDCSDSSCSFDSFCSGSGGGDTCTQHTTQNACQTTAAGQTGLNCTWVVPPQGTAYCGMPGTNCWLYASNRTGCNATLGCNWSTQVSYGTTVDYCSSNYTMQDICNKQTTASCADFSFCQNYTSSWSGGSYTYCDFGPRVDCGNLTNVTGCMANTNCTWTGTSDYSNHAISINQTAGPYCYLLYNNHSLTEARCNQQRPYFEWKASGGGGGNGTCMGTMFAVHGMTASGCFTWNGNQSGCISNNATCTWRPDGNAPGDAAAGARGWCESTGMFSMFQGITNFVPDHIMGTSGANTTLGGEIDIRFATVKETPTAYLFEVGVTSTNNSGYCNGFPLAGVSKNATGAGTNTTKFFYYLDTDGMKTNGCNIVMPKGVNLTTKFDFLIKHTTTRTGTETTDSRSLQRCINGDWSPTNTVVTSNPSVLCGMQHSATGSNGAMGVMIEKESFEKFIEFNKTTPMRLIVTSADSNGSISAPNDSTSEAGTYSIGSIGFDMVDCGAPGSSQTNPKCSKLKMFGFIQKENCYSSADDDNDGLVNCNDIDCKNEPNCKDSGVNSVVSSVYWGNDKVSPQLLFSTVDAYPDAASIKYTSNEPANGTIEFFDTDNNCTTLNKSIRDVGLLDPNMADFKDWHDGSVDAFSFNAENIGAKLLNGTTYYYKIKLCDEAGNCGISKCSNFTTAKSTLKKDCPSCNIVLKLTPPTGMNIQYDFGDGVYAQQVGTECGKKINYTQSKKAKIKIVTGNLSIELINVSLGAQLTDSAKSFNSTEMPNNAALSVGGETTGCLGFTQDKFDAMKSAGMIPEKLKIVIPKGTTTCKTLMQCNDCTAAATCKDISNDTGVAMINDTGSSCEWMIPGSFNTV